MRFEICQIDIAGGSEVTELNRLFRKELKLLSFASSRGDFEGAESSPHPSPQKGRGRSHGVVDSLRLPEKLVYKDNLSPSPLLGRGSGVRSRNWYQCACTQPSAADHQGRFGRAGYVAVHPCGIVSLRGGVT